MSWDAYVTNLCGMGANLSAFVGMDGNIWAQSAEFRISSEEMKKIIKSIQENSISANGVTLGGLKYTFIKGEDEKDFTCKLLTASGADKPLVHLSLSSTAIVIGQKYGSEERLLVQKVQYMRDYLKNLNI